MNILYQTRWADFLGLNHDVSLWIVFVLAILFMSAIIVGPFYYFYSYIERKVGADLQARIGPSLSGPGGVFQIVADTIKFLLKTPSYNGFKKQFFYECVAFSVLMSSLCFLPLSDQLVISSPEMGVWVVFIILFVHSVFRIFISSQTSNLSVFMQGLRTGHRVFSVAIPFGVVLASAGISVKGWGWENFVESQGFWIHQWLVFKSPFHLLAFFVFLIAGLIWVEAPPFENDRLPEALDQLTVSGRELLLDRITKKYARFFIVCFSVVVFLGGWKLPEWAGTGKEDFFLFRLFVASQVFVVLLKSFVVLMLISWISKTSPRIRTDQIADLSWRVLAPLSGVAFLGVLLWEGGKEFLW